MTKRLMAIVLATVMMLSLAIVGNFGATPTYAVDVVAEASPPWTPEETEAPTAAPTKAPTAAPTQAPTQAPTEAPVDVVTTASLVDEIEAFKAGISSEGVWIVSTLNNLVSEEALVVEGEFYHREALNRKISLYTQDADRNVTARFSLTAPKMTILSPNARIQSGFFIGDLYVSAPNFQLVDQQVDGNVYFTTQEAKDTFEMDENSSVSGELVLIEPDVVTTASLVDTNEALQAGIAEDGSWITSIVRDLTFETPLVLTGEFYHREALDRKISLYSQDEDRNVTRKFTITAPSLTIESPSARLQGGIFVGDLYVSAENFRLLNQEVDGNVYLTTEEAKATFTMDDKSHVSGDVILYQPDVVASASLVRTGQVFEESVQADGPWIVCLINDVDTENSLFVNGSFTYRETVQRKLALYSQDDERNVTRRFTLTAPKMFVNSPNTRVEKGIFEGDIYVTASNFRLNGMVVNGDIYIGGRADEFKLDNTVVNGTIYFANDGVQESAIIDELSTYQAMDQF